MSNKDYWTLTLDFLFENIIFLYDKKNNRIDEILDNGGVSRWKEVEIITKETDKQIKEIWKLIEYIYKYRDDRENYFWGVDKQ